jgi:hypothetical protein
MAWHEIALRDRDLLTPKWVGAVAYTMALGGPALVVGGIANRVSAAVQDVSDLVSRAFGSASRSASETARRVAPILTDTGGIAASGGAGRFAAQCGTVALTALQRGHPLPDRTPWRPRCLLASPVAGSSELAVEEPGGGGTPPATPRSDSTPPPQETGRSASSSAAAIAAGDAGRRSTRGGLLRPAAPGRHGRQARASEAKRDSAAEAAKAEATTVEEAAPVEELAPTESGPPPPATGAQVRGEVGH